MGIYFISKCKFQEYNSKWKDYKKLDGQLKDNTDTFSAFKERIDKTRDEAVKAKLKKEVGKISTYFMSHPTDWSKHLNAL